MDRPDRLPVAVRRGRARGMTSRLPIAVGGGAVVFEQGGAANLPFHHGPGPSPATLLLVGLVICVPVISAIVLVLLTGWTRSFLRRRRGNVRQLRAAAGVEARARAMMSELCPWGWRMQITLFDGEQGAPEDAPSAERAHVAVDWSEMDPYGHVAVARRVWGATIGEALDAMVADRRTDETLEQIERSAQLWES